MLVIEICTQRNGVEEGEGEVYKAEETEEGKQEELA